MSECSLLLLDAMGTLVRLRPPVAPLRAELERRFGAKVSAAEARTALAAEIGHYRRHLQAGRDDASLARLRDACARVLWSALPARPGLAEATQPEMTATLLAALHFEPFPDALPALRAARARGDRVVVVSNWDCSLHEVLTRTGLGAWIDRVVTSAEAGAWKPAPEIFDRALGPTAREHALHVGDSLEEDIAGACNAGIAAVLIRRDGMPGPPGVRTIASLLELGARSAGS